MTDILCTWLNDELQVSKKVEQINFEREFSSGYLVGEVLNKYQLQNDFDKFSQTKTADSKLNNFMRIEPVLHLLGIPFDTNVARDVMTEKHGVATRLMYQLYIALNNKKKANLTGVAMETMRPAAPAKLNAVESGIYKDRLKHVTPRQTDLDLDALVQRFHQKQIELEQTAFRERFLEQEKLYKQRQDHRQVLMERSRTLRLQQSEMVAKLQAATVHIPQPPPTAAKDIQMKQQERKKKEAQETITDIQMFEEKMKSIIPPSTDDDEGIDMDYIMSREEERTQVDAVDLIKPTSNDDYIGKIRKRLQEDSSARSEREKRRRKVLVDQMNAHEAQEDARREEMLVNRLMRQSQQERRIAVQLLQTRHEKEVIRRNRIMREKQYEERRLRDFEDALNREAEMARLAKEEYAEQTQKDQELHDRIAAERAEEKYRKHYETCLDVVNQIVDFTCKVAEYRELTQGLVPAKLMREWKSLFTAGKPLYEVTQVVEVAEPTPEQVLEEERQQLLDEGDFVEYKNMTGEWQPSEDGEVKRPPRDNPIVGHIVQRLFNMVHPPSPPAAPPEFPPFPIRACVLGKVFSGKTSCVQKLCADHRLERLNVDVLVDEAIEAHKNGEVMDVDQVSGSDESPTGESAQQEAAPPQVESPRDETPDEILYVAGQNSSPTPQHDDDGHGGEMPAERAGETTDTAVKDDVPADTEKTEVTKTSSPTKVKTKAPPKPQPTPRAKLGAKAQRFLKLGRAVDDQVIVDILVETIRRIPEGTGWVLDGFPTNYNQAKMLEKALSGYNAALKEDKKTADKGKTKKSNLVPDPRPPPPQPDPASGIDVVILFDVADDMCLRRAAGRTMAVQADKTYQQEFNPPPEGSATGVGRQEKVIPVEDPAHDQEQIQHRITGFLDNWPKLDKWFTKFGTLKKVDASQDQLAVCLEVEKILEDTVAKLQGKDQDSSQQVEPTETVLEEKKEEPPAPPPEPPKTPPAEEKGSRPGSRKGSGKKSASPGSGRSKSPKDKDKKRDKSGSPKRGSAKKSDPGSARKSRVQFGSSPKSKGKGSGKKKTPEPEPEPEPEVPEGPPPPEPGSEEWEFVDQNIEQQLAEVLAQHWKTVEETYFKNSKHVFRNIREERENIYRYFFKIRKDFLEYLRRPDHKQEFIARWQKDYNDVADDMRDDEETKAELHQRVDDLRELLWNICDERKAQAEQERETVMNDGWLDDRLGVLNNYYITLMQSEVDRFQDTVRMLKDYYRGMEGQIPDELSVNYARLPLIELPVERPESPEKPSSEATPTPPAEERPSTAKSGDRPSSKSPKSPKSPKGSRSKSPREKSPKDRPKSRSRTPSAKKRDKSKEKQVDVTPAASDGDTKKRIPLVPRRPTSADADGKKDKKPAKKKDDGVESPVPPTDPDEKLLFDAHQTALSAVGGIMQAEEAAREAAEEADRQRELEKQKELAAAAAAKGKGDKKGGKKGKSRSPSPKKGDKKGVSPSTPQPPSEPESEEEKGKKDIREKMKQEFYFAIKEEESAVKTRLELIKMTSMAILQDLKSKADKAYEDMNDWLGARFLKEMESIDHMSEVMRNCIENRQKLTEELTLQQEDFLLNEDLKVLKSPSPPPPPEEIEQPMVDQFTVAQLMNIYSQFLMTAPSGVMSSKSFVETFENMVSTTYGMEQIPDAWTTVSTAQIQEMANGMSPDNEYVDWRRFLLALAQPIPVPTQTDLLESLARCKDMDQRNTGFVTREQYDRMDLWFSTSGATSGGTFDRLARLKTALFDIFGDHNRTPPVLDYIDMLLYFSAAPHAQEGFMRALSVAAGTHMPRIYKQAQRADSASPDIVEDMDVPSPPPVPEDIPPEAAEAKVPLEALYRVLHHGESAKGDSHRFSVQADPEDVTSRERLAAVYQEVGPASEDIEPVQFKVLFEHPLIQDVIQACQTFKSIDLKSVLSNPSADNLDAHSTKTMD